MLRKRQWARTFVLARSHSVDLPGIELGTEMGVTCGNVEVNDAKVRGATCGYAERC
jgi:hypothetical protein